MDLPIEISQTLKKLEDAGYDAFLVGGCVRDALLGEPVSDYDVTTSALPEEVERVFFGERIIETGIKHGTVTLLAGNYPVEITTFRTDGEYLDSRHPESVSFSRNIGDDLSRRDFTVNSMAMSLRGELIDPFGGQNDVRDKIIRCTGDASTRFHEDALRIMRALRFSSTLGFEIEDKTASAIRESLALLEKISVERIFEELKKLLCGKDVFRILSDYPDVICAIIPEMAPTVGFDHKSRFHMYDVYTHIAKTVEGIEPDPTLRLTMLFHDIGKPYSYTESAEGVRHFKGHPEVSAAIARKWLVRMHADGETVRVVTLLCSIHDRIIAPDKKSVKRALNRLSYDELKMLCKVKRADADAHAPNCRERGPIADEVLKIADGIIRDEECFSLKDLAVNGDDMMSLGYRGPEIGAALNSALELVIDEVLPNDREKIVEYLKNGKTGSK